MQCRYEISYKTWWHSLQRTFCQEGGSLSISVGVGGSWNLGGEGGEVRVASISDVDGERNGGGVVPEGDGIVGDDIVGGGCSVSGKGDG